MKLNCVFAGTPTIAREVLNKLLEQGVKISLVLTKQDTPSGRGMKLRASEVKQLAMEHSIEVYQPESLKANLIACDKLKALKPDIMVVVAYGLMVPQEILNIPTLGCVNVHVSLLPHLRGAAPIARAILLGDKETGVSLMQLHSGLDTGDILLQARLDIANNETASSLQDKLAKLGAAKLCEFLKNPKYYSPQNQDSSQISYAPKITKAEAQINWGLPAFIIERNIRGYNPYPGAYTYLNNKLVKIWQASLINQEYDALPGTIVKLTKYALWIGAGDGKMIAIEIIQEAGSMAQTISQYLLGHKLNLGMHGGDYE